MIVLFLLVVGLTLKRTTGIATVRDIGLSDETVYLAQGVNAFVQGLPGAESGPLYVAWYAVLSLVVPDRVALYYTNWAVLLGLTLIVFWLLARRMGCGRIPTAVALALLSTLRFFDLLFSISLFAGIVIGGALVIAVTRPLLMRWAIVTAALGLASFVRPEFVLAFAISLVVCAWMLVQRRGNVRVTLLAGFVALGPFVLCSAILGIPFGGERAWIAVAQHYARNVIESTGTNVESWTELDHVAATAFPTARSVLEAAVIDSRALGWHMLRNLAGAPRLGYVVTPSLEMDRWLQVLLGIPVVGVILGGLVMCSRARARASSAVRTVAGVAAVVTPTTVASVVLVYPAYHYVTVLAFLLMLLALSGWDMAIAASDTRGMRARWLVPALVVLLLLLVPNRLRPWSMSSFVALPSAQIATASPLETLAAIELVRELPIPEDVELVILEAPDGIGFFSGRRVVSIAPDACPDIIRCITTRRVDVVIVNRALVTEYHARRSESVSAFLRTFPGYGFRKVGAAAVDVSVFYRPRSSL